MENENWYILRTYREQEYEAASLLNRVIPLSLCSLCRIPQKLKLFRLGGEFRLVKERMFPGYLFIRTANSGKLKEELKKSRELPQFFPFGRDETGEEELVPISIQDLAFLQQVCGKELQSAMGVSDIMLGENKQVISIHGALEHYANQIVKINLHRRFAVAEVPLFNRRQTILFGIRLEQDCHVVA